MQRIGPHLICCSFPPQDLASTLDLGPDLTAGRDNPPLPYPFRSSSHLFFPLLDTGLVRLFGPNSPLDWGPFGRIRFGV
jgi:hypothetical protein